MTTLNQAPVVPFSDLDKAKAHSKFSYSNPLGQTNVMIQSICDLCCPSSAGEIIGTDNMASVKHWVLDALVWQPKCPLIQGPSSFQGVPMDSHSTCCRSSPHTRLSSLPLATHHDDLGTALVIRRNLFPGQDGLASRDEGEVPGVPFLQSASEVCSRLVLPRRPG